MPLPFPIPLAALTRVLALTGAAVVAFAPTLVLPGEASAQNGWDQEFLTRMNAVRAEHGARPLAFDRRAQRWAEAWNPRQIREGQPTHQNLDVFLVGGVVRVGENVGASSESLASMFRGFMRSPSHRDNILDPGFTHVGIATVRAPFRGAPAYWTTHIFIRAVREHEGEEAWQAPAPPDPAAQHCQGAARR